MREGTPPITRLSDYRPPDFLVDAIELVVDLRDTETRVRSLLRLRRNPLGNPHAPLKLDGRNLQLRSLSLNQFPLRPSDYQVDDEQLTLMDVDNQCELTIETTIYPKKNTELEGLYYAGDLYCTQCEAEGFRRITYFPDRPDVLARFTTEIIADRSCPVLLSNGNLVASGEREDGRHWARWRDPFPKPSYLFAMVAGDLQQVRRNYTTVSGKTVQLRLFTEEQNISRCDHAMDSLEAAMRWDEQVYGREYDLNLYMIVATNHFNMGAMENKGLNIFNARYVLASPQTATDADYQNIESVIAHEYFHNWSGNRVTCRDWFQLSLKEGFTVFRDQQFSADRNQATVRRIQDVKVLRAVQFGEDAGPMAHPVRPDAYREINNFYTATVYNKGAEVVRMLHTLLGPEGFRRGTDLYFERHDGQAATIEDFIACMEQTNNRNFTQFYRWYDQAGTPELDVAREYDATRRLLTLKIRQTCPATPGQEEKKPFHIPLSMGLLGRDGNPVPLQLEGEEQPVGSNRVLELTRKLETFRFQNVPPGAVPSLLRGFSAPLKMQLDLSDTELALMFARDEDHFNRWEAGQQLASNILLARIRTGEYPGESLQTYLGATQALFGDDGLDPAMFAELLGLPVESVLADQLEVVDVDQVHQAREALREQIATRHEHPLLEIYQRMNGNLAQNAPDPAGRRALKNICLSYLMSLGKAAHRQLCWQQYRDAEGMTDRQAALALLANETSPESEQALGDFADRWKNDELVMDKWFQVQAMAPATGTVEKVRSLLEHPAFTLRNPNKVRALIGAFCQANPTQFHRSDGAGYEFFVEQILRLDPINPQITARLATALSHWKKHEPVRRQAMEQALQRIAAEQTLSRNLREIIEKIRK